jgi:hypothetical protein
VISTFSNASIAVELLHDLDLAVTTLDAARHLWARPADGLRTDIHVVFRQAFCAIRITNRVFAFREQPFTQVNGA